VVTSNNKELKIYMKINNIERETVKDYVYWD
jgi:hypothetical protein